MHTEAVVTSLMTRPYGFLLEVGPERGDAPIERPDKGTNMLNRVGSSADGAGAEADQKPAPGALEARLPADFTALSGDEIERLIELCEAPALLWRRDTKPAREPEPFGMIA